MRLEVAYSPGRNHALVGTNSLRTRAGSDLSRAVAATVPVQPTGPSLPRLRLRYLLRHKVAHRFHLESGIRQLVQRQDSTVRKLRVASFC